MRSITKPIDTLASFVWTRSMDDNKTACWYCQPLSTIAYTRCDKLLYWRILALHTTYKPAQ